MTNQTLSTGFSAIDKITGGFHVLAGQPGVGRRASLSQ